MQIFYINLARRTDRRVSMEQRLGALGLRAERIEAVRAEDVSAAQVERFCNPRRYRWLTKPELACGLSHRLAVAAFAQSGARWGLVLEDDAVLSAHLPTFLQAWEAAAPGVDLLRIESDPGLVRLYPQPEWTIGGCDVYRTGDAGGGAAGYILSQQGAARILRDDDILSDLTDQVLLDPLRPLGRELQPRQLVPGLLVQEDRHPDLVRAGRQGSDLEAERTARFSADAGRMLARLPHGVRAFWERDVVRAMQRRRLARAHGVRKRLVPFRAE